MRRDENRDLSDAPTLSEIHSKVFCSCLLCMRTAVILLQQVIRFVFALKSQHSAHQYRIPQSNTMVRRNTLPLNPGALSRPHHVRRMIFNGGAGGERGQDRSLDVNQNNEVEPSVGFTAAPRIMKWGPVPWG